MNNLSPAVERAVAAVSERAPAGASVADWLAVLLADDEARPAMLLARVGVSGSAVLGGLGQAAMPAPGWEDLARSTRALAIALRADPDFTTDHVMIALFKAHPEIARRYGIIVAELENAVRSPLVESGAAVSPADAPPAVPIAWADPTDRHDALRILDANLNRARESLRILDDYARFIRADATLTAMVKALRHRLGDMAAGLPLPSLLAARDTPADVGTTIEATGEYDRSTTAQIAQVNIKRLQESLRSAEEFGKLISAHVGRELEAARYQSYTLEKALFRASSRGTRLATARLYFLATASQCVANLAWTVAEAIAGGVDIIQLREKSATDRDIIARARELRTITRDTGTLLIVNDRPDMARLVDADGVHLGQDDLTVAEARRIVGPEMLIGVSTHTVGEIEAAIAVGADMIGIGPTFPSTTKSFDAFSGLAFIREATQATRLPAFALGGINLATIGEAIAAGATRVAVSAAIATAADPRLTALQLKNAMS
jgi:thiamine-phosphate pyrophosphorylase